MQAKQGNLTEMSSTNPVKPADLAASDVLSAQLWVQRQGRSGLGLDVACTKAAVDLQYLTRTVVAGHHRSEPRDAA